MRWYNFAVSIHALLAECDDTCAGKNRQSTGFNPRTPCGVRLALARLSDVGIPFQSTHSLRSATQTEARTRTMLKVSIHALLAECDAKSPPDFSRYAGFNPRTPCGVRPDYYGISFIHDAFQSTHSLRSATVPASGGRSKDKVSIHALLAECDLPAAS